MPLDDMKFKLYPYQQILLDKMREMPDIKVISMEIGSDAMLERMRSKDDPSLQTVQIANGIEDRIIVDSYPQEDVVRRQQPLLVDYSPDMRMLRNLDYDSRGAVHLDTEGRVLRKGGAPNADISEAPFKLKSSQAKVQTESDRLALARAQAKREMRAKKMQRGSK